MSTDLTKDPVAQTLYRLTSPMVIGILAIFFFNLVDTFFIGLLGTEALAAVSFTFPITMMVMNIAIGLSIATGAVVARAIGQQDLVQASQWISSSLMLGVVVAISVATVGVLSQEMLFSGLGAEPHLIPLIKEYLNWWFPGSVLLVVMIVINASIRAAGNTKLPSIMMMVSAALNGLLDPLLIFGIGPFPELGIQGAAIATIISWAAAFAFITHKIIRDQLLQFSVPDALFDNWKKLLSLGIPAALTNMLGPLANGILVSLVAVHGTAAVAAYGVGLRLEPLAAIVIMAFTASLPPFVGQNSGAGNPIRIADGLKKSMQFIFVWQILIYFVMVLNAHSISALFSDNPDVQAIIQLFIYILPLSYAGMGFCLVSTATLNALHKTRLSLVINLLRLFVFYLPFAWFGNLHWGLTGLFWGCAIGNLAVGAAVVIALWQINIRPNVKTRLLTLSS